MNVIPHPPRDVTSPRRRPGSGPPAGLRFERRSSGTAVTGPGFHVWDVDHEVAVSWAEQLGSSGTWHLPGAVHQRLMPHVLIAEDDSDLRQLVAQTFRSRGYQVTECVDGPDLVAHLGSYVLFGPPAGFDLLVSDIRMPGATALEILEAMRECEGLPPVILITAFPSEGTLTAACQLGVTAVLDKPFAIEDLVAKAEDLMSQRSGDLP